MSTPLSTAVLLALLTQTPALAQSTPGDTDRVAARLLELTADNAGQVHELGIGDHPISLVFNVPLLRSGVEVEDERLVAMAVNEARGLVTLLPSDVPPDRRLWLRVRFADGAVPESVTFRLVVRPTRADQEVRVYRRARCAESLEQEVRQQQQRAEQCEARLVLVEQQHPEGLMGQFDARLIGDGHGIEVRNILKDITQHPGDSLLVDRASSYRAKMGNRVAVELWVKNTGTLPWTVDGVARLMNKEGIQLRVLNVWPREPIPPGETHQLVVEAEATGAQCQGTFTLQLGEDGGPRTLTVRGVTWP